MSRRELRIVTRAAVGIAAGLGAFASAAAATEAGDVVLRSAWSAAGGHVGGVADMLAAAIREPSAVQVAGFTAVAIGLAALSLYNLASVRSITVQSQRSVRSPDPRDRLEL